MKLAATGLLPNLYSGGDGDMYVYRVPFFIGMNVRDKQLIYSTIISHHISLLPRVQAVFLR
jgi:hypothetical protein